MQKVWITFMAQATFNVPGCDDAEIECNAEAALDRALRGTGVSVASIEHVEIDEPYPTLAERLGESARDDGPWND